MLRKLYKKIERLGGFAQPIATSLLFLSLIIIIIYATIYNKLNIYTSLFNNIAVTHEVKKDVNVKYDLFEKKLKTYPHYGEVYGKIKLLDVNREMPLYHGDDLDIMKYGAGHYAPSYFPGEGGSIIIAAHNSDEYFMHLPDLKIGSIVEIETSYGTFKYELYETKVIGDHDGDELPVQNEKEILMLYTCWPINYYGFKDHRYVGYFKLVGEEYAK